MTFIPTIDYSLEVSRGQITGHIGVFQFGRNFDVDAAEDIWAAGGDFVPPTTARTHNIASSSANDTSAGTGARTVKIYGLSSAYALQSETITMNGTSNVATASSYTFIYKMEVLTAGSGGLNAGNITATAQTDSTVSSYMPIGYNASADAFYMIPAGYTAYIDSFKAGISNTTASQSADVGLFIKPFGGVYNLKALHSLVNSGSSVEENIFYYPLVATEKSIIKLRCTAVQSANTDIQGEINFILVAN